MPSVDSVTTFYATQGVLGITVIALSIVLYYQTKLHRQDIKDRDITIATLQDKRAIEAATYAEKYVSTSQELLGMIKEILKVSQGNQESIRTIANILMSMKK